MKPYSVDIVVVDSGVSSIIPKENIVGGISFVGTSSDDYMDNNGHGTSICGIILNHCPNCRLFVIKITDVEYRHISQDLILRALQFIRDNVKCHIVNISAGTKAIEHYDEWNGVIEDLSKQKTVVVSAFSNDGSISYPAAFNNTIGVDESDLVKDKKTILWNSDSDVVNILIKPQHYKVKSPDNKYIFVNGVSFSCAYVSAMLLCEMRGDNIPLFETVNKSHIKEKNTSSVSDFVHSIHRAILFPFNKEMHSLVTFQDLLTFDIEGVYDFRKGMNRNREICHVLRFGDNHSIIKSFSEIDWNQEFDSVICGHCTEYEARSGELIKKELIQKCLQYQKKCFFFDDITELLDPLSEEEKRLFTFPCISEKDLPTGRVGKLRQSAKPVLGVFGTSSVQGKYTMQLLLRRELLKRGYKVGQISTEPSGYLFGMNYVFPFGYNSTVHIAGRNTISVLNEAIWNIEQENPDIILSGCQSGTIPQNFNNIACYPIESYDFLLGIHPDAVLLCANIYDSIEYIERTMHFIEASGRCKVIGICVSPLTISKNHFASNRKKIVVSQDEIDKFYDELREKITIPFFQINSDSIAKCVDCIEAFFS